MSGLGAYRMPRPAGLSTPDFRRCPHRAAGPVTGGRTGDLADVEAQKEFVAATDVPAA
ncbi:hypothetical protein [Streptomyces sp. I5]|uniref:hypothetical protein n=1 Tax=Streptomyces sp. I5 TaxID=2759947 RepID=UPI0018EE53A2|nr:hypothetical protein [Streptomyces sp. I5]MBJ6630246.1 hypothetical protein [Streptomyces sp. I5]